MEIVTFVEIDVGLTPDTYRFGYASEQQRGYDHIPSLKSVNVRPAVLDPGESIGQRETITISCLDHLHRFDVDNFEDGTFWTKFRARYNTIEGAPVRVYRGLAGQALADMDIYLYVADSLQISRSGASIVAKDPLSLLDTQAAQAPRASEGELDADLLAAGMTFDLLPVGVGDLQYPAAGKGVLGGSELIEFTRVADTITIVQRGINIPADDHDEGTKFQLALEYVDKTPSFLVNDLLLGYTSVNPAWINILDWESSVDAFVDRIYSAIIADPTSVKKLLDELCQQIALVFYWDAAANQIRLRPLLANATTGMIPETKMLESSFNSTEQPAKRVSQIWTYYAQRDPCESVDEPNNYKRVLVKIAPNAGDFPKQSIRKIFSRWIPFPGRATAQRLNELIIARYQIPPRKFKFSLFRNEIDFPPPLSAVADVRHWFLVDANGIQTTVKSQMISVANGDAEIDYDAEELRFVGTDLGPEVDKFIFIESDLFDVNLRDLFEEVYTEPNDGDTVTFVVEENVRIGATTRDTGLPALHVGDWPELVDLFLVINNARIEGVGGTGGGARRVRTGLGGVGGTAIFTRRAITIKNNGGHIWGAGGGGGAGRLTTFPDGATEPVIDDRSVGGGGAGFLPGFEGTSAIGVATKSATEFLGSPGDGVRHGRGGNPGFPGQNAPGGAVGATGGAAGKAIDGISFVTFDGPPGDIIGAQVN